MSACAVWWGGGAYNKSEEISLSLTEGLSLTTLPRHATHSHIYYKGAHIKVACGMWKKKTGQVVVLSALVSVRCDSCGDPIYTISVNPFTTFMYADFMLPGVSRAGCFSGVRPFVPQAAVGAASAGGGKTDARTVRKARASACRC